MQISAKPTKLCPMCNEINHIDVGQVGFVCSRCGYSEGVPKRKELNSKFKKSKPPKGLGRKEF